MDTKWKSSLKTSILAKTLCLLLALAFLATAAFASARAVLASYYYGAEINGQAGSFLKSRVFVAQFRADTDNLAVLSNADPEGYDALITEQKTDAVNYMVREYKERQAVLVKTDCSNVLYEVEERLGEEADDDTARAYEEDTEEYDVDALTEETEAAYYNYDTDYYWTTDQLKKIRATCLKAQEAEDTATVLKYQNFALKHARMLLGLSAQEEYFNRSVDIETYDLVSTQSWDYDCDTMTASAKTMRSLISAWYDSMQTDALETYQEAIRLADQELSQRTNLKYYIRSADGTVYTNLEEKPSNEEVRSYRVHGIVKDGQADLYTVGEAATDGPAYTRPLTQSRGVVRYYLTLDEEDLRTALPYSYEDVYGDLAAAYQSYTTPSMPKLLLLAGFCAAAAIVLLILWLSMLGWRRNEAHPKALAWDRFPTDLHLALSATALALFITACAEQIQDHFAFDQGGAWLALGEDTQILPWILAAIAAVVGLIFAEWIGSTVRLKKAGESWTAHLLLAKVARWLKTNVFYKPKKYRTRFLLWILLWILGNIAGVVLLDQMLWPFVGAAVLVVWNLIFAALLLRYLRTLDQIIEASARHESADLSHDKVVPPSLETLNNNLSSTAAERKTAIEQAVKDEKTKTELITNVSHDLKTPLTSIITYTDLLQKEDLSEDDRRNFTQVLNQQAIKLKRLIEDLIDASKISSGNVTLNRTPLNFNELLGQAIAETDFTGANELKVSMPDTPVTIYADGQRTYRILENLLTNAKKYSAPGTRIYIDLGESDSAGVLSIKNTSAEPLNVSPDVLTERFVQGDASRGTHEGNGLGLSIAKDLCALHGGTLDITIDGDLFKATVTLPKYEPTDK